MRGIKLAIALQLLWAAPALADVQISGTVTWDVVEAQGGYVMIFGQSEEGFFTLVPIEIDQPGGKSGSYSATVPPDDYALAFNVGDCADIVNTNCPNQLTISAQNVVPVPGDTVFDVHPPAGWGAARVSGTVILDGGAISSGEANISYGASDGEFDYFGYSIVPFGSDGNYAAAVGSGQVYAGLIVHQAGCVLDQFLDPGPLDVAAGDDVAFPDAVGQANPLAPAPGKIQVKTGLTGYDVYTNIREVGFGDPVQDCSGGWSRPHTVYDDFVSVPAGTWFLVGGGGGFVGQGDATSISVGTYELRSTFNIPIPDVVLDYTYTTKIVDVQPSSFTTLDYRINPAFIKGKWKLDWAVFAPGYSDVYTLAAFVDDVPGHVFSARADWLGFWDGLAGVHNYEFKLPVDPKERWRFGGISFAVDFPDGTFQNIHVIPEADFADDYPTAPALNAGQSKTYNFDGLMSFGMGAVVFAPTTFAQGLTLDGTIVETIAAGTRNAYLHTSGSFDSASIHGTPMQGRSTLSASWYDADFNTHAEALDFDLRATETVSLTESAPRIDNLKPLPGRVCAHKIDVTGRVTDPHGVASLKVNGQSVAIKAGGSFKTTINVPSGNSTLEVKAVDAGGHSMVRSRPLRFSQNCQ